MIKRLLYIVFLIPVISCIENPQPIGTIWQYIQSRDDLSEVTAILERNNFASILNEPGDYTLFIPENKSLERFPQFFGLKNYSELPEDNQWLDSLIFNHILTRSYMSNTFSEGSVFTTDSLEEIEIMESDFEGIEIANQGPYNSTLLDKDIFATNGVIHIISHVLLDSKFYTKFSDDLDRVILPLETANSISVFNIALDSADSYARGAGLTTIKEQLSNILLEFTVLAVPDVIFDSQGIVITDFTNQEWFEFLKDHILVGNYGLTEAQQSFDPENPPVTMNGNTINIMELDIGNFDIDKDGNTDLSITDENFGTASNGAIHIVNGFIVF